MRPPYRFPYPSDLYEALGEVLINPSPYSSGTILAFSPISLACKIKLVSSIFHIYISHQISSFIIKIACTLVADYIMWFLVI
jgi:hypothetical protein